MSSPSNLSSVVNLEFLRKEAKSLLKLCRSRDTGALARIRSCLPRFGDLDGERIAIEIKLADIQHALAQERGFANWGELKHQDRIKAAPDFSKPGSDGVALPEGFSPWRWCVSYTVRPEVLSPLACGEEYHFGASVLRHRPQNETFSGYADLYEHATAIVRARTAELMCHNGCRFLHTRILAHTWFRHGDTNLVRAAVTLGVTCLNDGETEPEGESKPTRDALSMPGGITAEQLAARDVKKGFDEVYSDGDVRLESETSGIFTFSYGEYVKTAEEVDYAPLMNRAERLTRFHLRLPRVGPQSGGDLLNIVRREWFCATNPDIAVVHVYVQT